VSNTFGGVTTRRKPLRTNADTPYERPTIDGVLSPVAIGRVVCCLFAVGVDQEVAIHQEHRSILFRGACLWSRSMPGHVPVPCMVIIRTRPR